MVPTGGLQGRYALKFSAGIHTNLPLVPDELYDRLEIPHQSPRGIAPPGKAKLDRAEEKKVKVVANNNSKDIEDNSWEQLSGLSRK